MAAGRLGMRARTMVPGYTPHKHAVPASIAELLARFTQRAQSIYQL
jgi:hypothetical protein